MVPKFIMAGGQLVKVLIHTGVANYMEFKPVDGSYVYRKGSSGGKIFKVPTTPKEAMKSGMLGMVEKGRMAQFTAWVDAVKLEDRASWVSKGMTGSTKLALDTMSGACTRSARPRSKPSSQSAQQPARAARPAAARLWHPGPTGRACRARACSAAALLLGAGAEFFKFWKLDPSTVEFLTHACALYRDETYLSKPAYEIVERMKVRAARPPVGR